MSNRALVLFCVLVFALSWAIQFAVIAQYGNPENPAATPWLVVTMFTPALVTLGFAAFSRNARSRIVWKCRHGSMTAHRLDPHAQSVDSCFDAHPGPSWRWQ